MSKRTEIKTFKNIELFRDYFKKTNEFWGKELMDFFGYSHDLQIKQDGKFSYKCRVVYTDGWGGKQYSNFNNLVEVGENPITNKKHYKLIVNGKECFFEIALIIPTINLVSAH